MTTPTFTGLNPTRAAISDALTDAGGDWCAAIRPVGAHLRDGMAGKGIAFVTEVLLDLDAPGSPTLRAAMIRALDATPDPAAALRLAGQLVDRRDNPELAATVWRETKTEMCRAAWRALRAHDHARRQQAPPPAT